MGDPVTTGMIIGAVGGAATSKNPIEGAMMGGAMGAAGGSFAGGFGGLTGGAPALGTTSAASGFAGGNLAAAQNAVNPTFMQQLGGGLTGVKDAFGGANTYLNQNPFTAQAGMSLAQSAFQPEQPMQMAPQGQIRQGQVQPMDYMSLLNPQQQSVIRPQPISLL